MTTGGRTLLYEVMYESPKRGTMFDGLVRSWGSYRTRPEAEQAAQMLTRSYWTTTARWWIETIDVTGGYELPSRPAPRERYTTRVLPDPGLGGSSCHVQVVDGARLVGAYDRNYAMLRTFEPFRQADHDYALVSPDKLLTSVLDLESGEIIATEQRQQPAFYPAGYYVPDWWDVHGEPGTRLPGSSTWRDDDEWPSGLFGFVWGAHVADDAQYKVQYLDLSRIQQGILVREERFGYLEIAAHDKLDGRDFILCENNGDGDISVRLAVERTYDLNTGKLWDG